MVSKSYYEQYHVIEQRVYKKVNISVLSASQIFNCHFGSVFSKDFWSVTLPYYISVVSWQRDTCPIFPKLLCLRILTVIWFI